MMISKSWFISLIIGCGIASTASAEIFILDCGEKTNNEKIAYAINGNNVRLIGIEESNILNSASRVDEGGRIVSTLTVNISSSPSFFIVTISPLNEDRTDYQMHRVNSVDGDFEAFDCKRDVGLEDRLSTGVDALLLDLEGVQNPGEVLMEAILARRHLSEEIVHVEDSQTITRPLTGGEEDRLRQAVSQCWVVDNSADWSSVAVTVGFSLTQDGKVSGDVRLLNSSGGSEAATRQAFEAARRAILRCQSSGYPLPVSSYEHWKNVELIFDPTMMRVR